MTRTLTKCVLAAIPLLVYSMLFTGVSFAQTSSIEGKVIGEDGQPLRDALIRIERKDIRGNYKVKTKKNGEYFHAGLPLGTYRVILEVGGKVFDQVDNVRTRLGESTAINFNIQELRQKQQSMQQAAQSGTLTEEQKREMTPEQRAAMEKAMKEQAEAMRKNTALNDAFNVGMTALQARQFDQAVDAFNKAAELDAKQHVVWGQMAEAYMGMASTKPATEQEAVMVKGLEAYQKALELKPDDAAYHNNYALALARAKKFDEAQAELTKAAQLDPAQAGKFFYNLGAVLVNIGQLEPAGDAFKKAIEADPNYAPAQYQYGVYLISKASTTADGKVVPPPGTAEAFQKYLELDPNGQFADSARGMLATITGTVQTEYVNPDAKQKKRKK